uniref:Uncharacterized protein n=1 Tax=Anguilla anguilla TaxID=7936 RepID=A0A0E9VID5_ANGAN
MKQFSVSKWNLPSSNLHVEPFVLMTNASVISY